MGAREEMGANIDQGLVQRVVTGLRYMVSGVTPESWFGPSQPIAPQAQDKAEGRALDYPVGFNLRMQPRSGENVSFGMMRALADGYDLLRLVIETRKDQIESFDWEIVPREKEANAAAMAGDIKRVTEFLAYPDKEHNWPQWLRMQVEDMLVLDAVAVYPRANRGGDLYGFELIDPGTLKRVIDDSGRTPLPPDPAYQQILKGIPAADYSRDQLVYTMRNPRTNRIYGYSPVEQVMMTVNIALRRQLSQLDFYTQGTVPEALAQVPDTWSMKQIADFQLWWDGLMEGNSAAKRKMRFIPSLKDIVFPRAGVVKDEYDEWLARIVCFAFSISPSALIKQVNRASGEQMADTAKEEGLMPLLRFLEAHLTMLVQKYLKAPNLRFQFRVVNRVDPLAQAQIHGVYIDKKVLTPDEVREDLDKDALTPEQRAEAFPAPVSPFGAEPELDEDGKPVLDPLTGQPKTKAPSVGGAPAGTAKAPPPTETPAEKMLARVLDMIDPQRIAKALIDRARAEPPQVIELRPEVNVEVGDTNVHNALARSTPTDEALAKRADAKQDELVAAVLKLADRESVVNVAPAAVTVNMPEQTIHVAAPEVSVQPAAQTFHVAAPEVHVAPADVTVNVAAPEVAVNLPPPVDTEQLVERDHNHEVTRTVTRAIK